MDGTSVRSGLAQNSANQLVVQPAADSCSSRAARSVAVMSVMSVLQIAGADGGRLVGFGVRWAARPGAGGIPRAPEAPVRGGGHGGLAAGSRAWAIAVKSAAEAAGGRPAKIPPSMARSWPVINEEASLASHNTAAATSAGTPARRIGW